MEPRIQYAKTSDGVSIAYCVTGEGAPLVHVPWLPLSHLQLEWQNPEVRRWYERLAERRMLIRHDGRGTGLSERDATDVSLDARVLDLEAVVDRLGLERFALLAGVHSGPIAITFAARNPERLSHLVLWSTYARGSDFSRSPQVQGIRAVLDKDWQTFTEASAHALLAGWGAGELARRLAALFQESITQETMQAFVSVANEVDVTGLLAQVTAPTLVLHRRQSFILSLDAARGLAAGIPNARLALLEGTSVLPYVGDVDAALRAIDEFLGSDVEERQVSSPSESGGPVSILFTDVEGSTALTQRLGDAAAREVLREHERIVREALAAHGGSEVKTMGDGFMASFASATRALECAIAVQRAFAGWNAGVRATGRSPLPEPVRVRIGLNAGEPIAEQDDLHGTAVIMAARIAAQAQGGEILVSNVVRELVAGKGFLFSDRGDAVLRGFEDPVRLFEVSWREAE